MTATHRKDSDIKTDIIDELKWAPEIQETEIGVIVKNGAVILAGTVSKYAEKEAAKHAAKRIKGVKAVADEIEVKLPSQMIGSDEEIAHHIANIFEWNTQIPGDDIKASVRKGIVTLSGEVDWQYQKNYVKQHIQGIKGVKSVMNDIIIRKRATARDVKNEIVRALHRHAGLEAANVNVSVVNGTVTLDGKVDTYYDMDVVEDAVWAAPGVTHLVDKLRVGA
jgi:osmotically-inducible protein OsmY